MRAAPAIVMPLVLAWTLVLALLAVPAPAQTDPPFPPDTLAVGTSTGGADNTRISVAFSEATFEAGVEVVAIGRDDVFADSLASGLLQSGSPLLLVPQAGPVPQAVLDEIARIGATTAVVLGGETAVSQTVVDELEAAGLRSERRAGPTRIETAIEVARTDAPAADTAILARAAGVEGNPTAAFADTLAAGGWAAANRWPVLLTQTEVLSSSTRDYITSSSIRTVNVLGGTAAISQAVTDELAGMGVEVVRVAGPDRAATAIAVAEARGESSSADVEQVIVVDGFGEQAWAAGFSAAAMSADAEAPVVLGNDADGSLPPATEEWLVEGPVAITCAVSDRLCDTARLELGFDPAVPVEIPAGAVTYTVADEDSSAIHAATFDGQPIGLAWPCTTAGCSQIDWTDDGTWLAVRQDDRAVFAVTGTALGQERIVAGRQEGQTLLSVDAFTDGIGRQQVSAIAQDDGFFAEQAVNVSAAGQVSSGSAPGPHAGVQATALHPDTGRDDVGSVLHILPNGDLEARSGSFAFDLGINRRPGAEMTGAAFNPDGSGDIAVVDQVGGTGLLRTLAWQSDAIVEAADLDVTNTPFWTPDGQVAVLVDTGGAIAVALVDPTDGSAEIVLDDAGDADGQRITTDASGTFIAWRTVSDIRVLDTRDGTVTTILPPEGMAIAGGPAFRP